MKIKGFSTLLATLTIAFVPSMQAADIDGNWKSEFESPIGHLKYVYELKADGEKLSGKAIRNVDGQTSETTLREGKISGTDLSFVEVIQFDSQDFRIEYKGKLDGTRLQLTRRPGEFDPLSIVATREASTATSTTTGSSAAKKISLKVVKVDSEESEGEDGKGANAVDGYKSTIWHTQWQDSTPQLPHEIIIELDPPSSIKGFTYLPRQDEENHGDIKDYEFYVSNDGKDFGQPVKKGTFNESKEMKTATFDSKSCRFVKLKAISEIAGEDWTSAAEITVIPAGD